MQLTDYIEEIKLELTGGILELEIPDETIGTVVKKAFREVQRYIDTTRLITIPYAKCIDLSGFELPPIHFEVLLVFYFLALLLLGLYFLVVHFLGFDYSLHLPESEYSFHLQHKYIRYSLIMILLNKIKLIKSEK